MNKKGRVTTISRQLKSVRLEWETAKMRTLISALCPRSEEKLHIRSGGKDQRRMTFKCQDFTCSIYNEPDSVDRVSWVEFTLDFFDAPLDWGWDEWKEKEQEFQEKYKETVEEAMATLGSPNFSGGYGIDGYPEDDDAVILALWSLTNGEVRIALRHEDREVPIRLCITLRRLSEKR